MKQELPSLDAVAESKRAIEAMVLVASEPTPVHLLAQVVELAPEVVEVLCRDLAAEYEQQKRGFQFVEVAGGWIYQTHPDLYAYVERYAMEGIPNRLSSAALETLAIVAYKQPISRSQIGAIRGVNIDGVLRTLEQRGYVEEVGRDDGPGQAALFGTTPMFLEKLGLPSLKHLPALGDFVPAAHVVEALEQTLRVNPHQPDEEPVDEELVIDEATSDDVASNGVASNGVASDDEGSGQDASDSPSGDSSDPEIDGSVEGSTTEQSEPADERERVEAEAPSEDLDLDVDGDSIVADSDLAQDAPASELDDVAVSLDDVVAAASGFTADPVGDVDEPDSGDPDGGEPDSGDPDGGEATAGDKGDAPDGDDVVLDLRVDEPIILESAPVLASPAVPSVDENGLSDAPSNSVLGVSLSSFLPMGRSEDAERSEAGSESLSGATEPEPRGSIDQLDADDNGQADEAPVGADTGSGDVAMAFDADEVLVVDDGDRGGSMVARRSDERSAEVVQAVEHGESAPDPLEVEQRSDAVPIAADEIAESKDLAEADDIEPESEDPVEADPSIDDRLDDRLDDMNAEQLESAGEVDAAPTEADAGDGPRFHIADQDPSTSGLDGPRAGAARAEADPTSSPVDDEA